MIKLENLTVGYDGIEVLNSISFTVSEKQLISVVGTNGSGKSTLLKTIARMLEPMSGSVLVQGKNANEYTRLEYAKKIAYLSQGRNVPDMTVEQFVLHGRFPYLNYPRRYTELDRKITYSAMEHLHIDDYAEKTLSNLSGGQRQKAYIAMSLAQDTDYILLDEPTTYLDITHQISLMQTLRDLADGGKGVVTVMHDLPLAFSFSDKVLVLHEGEVLAFDSPENVCKQQVLQKVFNVDVVLGDDGIYHYEF